MQLQYITHSDESRGEKTQQKKINKNYVKKNKTKKSEVAGGLNINRTYFEHSKSPINLNNLQLPLMKYTLYKLS
jgi:hypothetical protein